MPPTGTRMASAPRSPTMSLPQMIGSRSDAPAGWEGEANIGRLSVIGKANSAPPRPGNPSADTPPKSGSPGKGGNTKLSAVEPVPEPAPEPERATDDEPVITLLRVVAVDPETSASPL